MIWMTRWLLGSGVSVGSVKDRTVVVVMLQELYTCSGGRLFVAKIQHLWIAACQLLNHIHLAIAVLVLSCLQIRVLLVDMPLLAAISQQRWKNLRGGGVISLTMEAWIKKKKLVPCLPFFYGCHHAALSGHVGQSSMDLFACRSAPAARLIVKPFDGQAEVLGSSH